MEREARLMVTPLSIAGATIESETFMPTRCRSLTVGLLVLVVSMAISCGELTPPDPASLLIPALHRSEIIGFLAGLGTTFAAVPDLYAMFRRRSSAGMNPRMATITGLFQVLWVYYGLLIVSRPVIAWNIIGVLINATTLGAYRHFRRLEKAGEFPLLRR
jgi:MtN3 and saliva related transmembrane protein